MGSMCGWRLRILSAYPALEGLDRLVKALQRFATARGKPERYHEEPFLFRDTLLRLIQSDNLEYKELTKAA